MPTRSPFIGRQEELSELEDAVCRAQSGNGSVVLIGGTLGIGKTRLVEEFSSKVERTKAIVLRGRWYESAEMPAYIGFQEALLPLLRNGALLAAIDRSSPYVRGLAKLGPEFAVILGLEGTDNRSPVTDEKYRLWRGISLALSGAAQVAPLVLVLDDLQWADTGSLGLISFLGDEITKQQILLLGTYREEDALADHPIHSTIAELVRSRTLVSLHLSGLSREEVGALAAGMTGSDVAAEFVDSLHKHTAGNPLFVEELVRHLTQQSSSAADKPREMVAIDPRDLEAPEGVQEIMRQRLSRLSQNCQNLLTTVAVVGRDFEFSLVERVSEMDRDALFLALDEAAQASVIREAAPGLYSFAHPLMRSVIYRGMASSKRLTTHLKLADATEAQYGSAAATHAREIARHLIAAGGLADASKLLNYGLQGAKQARALFAFEEAQELLTGALSAFDLVPGQDLALRAEVLMELGYAESALGRPNDGIRSYREALTIHETTGNSDGATDVRRWLAGCLIEYGRTAEALAVTREGLSGAQLKATHPYHGLIGSHAFALLFNGLVVEAEPWVTKLSELACDTVSRSAADHVAGIWHAWGAGDRQEAGPCFRRSCQMILAEGLDGTAAQIAWNHAVSSYFLGQFDESVDAQLQSERLASATGRVLVLSDNHAFRSLIHVQRGERQEALQERKLWQASAATLGGTTIGGQLARRGEALERLWSCGPAAASDPLDTTFLLNAPLFPMLRLESGDRDGAVMLLEAIQSRVPPQGHGLLWLAAALPIVSALCTLKIDSASDWYDSLSTHSGCLSDWFLVDIELGRISGLMTRWQDAERQFAQAERLCLAQGLRPFLGQVYYQRALMLLSRRAPGDRRLAFSLLQEADELFGALGLEYLQTKARAVLATPLKGRPPSSRTAGLTNQEVAVLTLLAEGKSNHEIAERLFVTDKTVEHHMGNIYSKLGVSGRAAAIARALREGIV